MYWMLTKPNCPHCDRAKAVLDKAGLPYQAFSYDTHPMLGKLLIRSGLRTVPQIWHESEWVGGADALDMYLSEA